MVNIVTKSTIKEYTSKGMMLSEIDNIKTKITETEGDADMTEVVTPNGCVLSVRWGI